MEWTAFYNDNSSLHQFEGEKEHLFSEIDHKKLDSFALIKNNKIEAAVNLNTGQIHIKDNILEFPKFKDAKFKLIYFRRVRQVIGTQGGTFVKEYIGWQTTIKEKAYKRIITFKDNIISIECE